MRLLVSACLKITRAQNFPLLHTVQQVHLDDLVHYLALRLRHHALSIPAENRKTIRASDLRRAVIVSFSAFPCNALYLVGGTADITVDDC